jgi:CrcB protein
MRIFLVIALGAALGANARYVIATWAVERWGTAFPYGTMIINVAGCFLIGVVLALAAMRPWIDIVWQRLLVTGLLGGFTTFSTFSYETYDLLMRGNWLAAAANVIGSAVLGLVAVALGVWVGRLAS